jgi:glyoxylase-like metal-dependent hydrolase (beta-lactamase superfamily II)
VFQTIDLKDRAPNVIAAFMLETTQGPVLFETGPESRYANLLEGIQALGYHPRQIRHVFVTHIHLDHAGAAWRFAEHGATVYVHPKGAPHLMDPSKLWNSASRIYGDQMEVLWGQMGYVPEAQVRVLQDGEAVQIGDQEIIAHDTPGHANHHHAYQVGSELIAGDVGGIQIGKGPMMPPCPPPEIHIEAWQQSLAKLKALNLKRIYLTHFGGFDDVNPRLEALGLKLHDWADWVKQAMLAGKSYEQMVPEFRVFVESDLRAAGMNDREVLEYELADPSWMSVQGLMRYWSKHHPEEVRV